MTGRLIRAPILAATVCAGALLSACAVGPDFDHPAAPAADHYAGKADPVATASADGIAQRFDAGAAVEAEWWKLFQSPVVDRVVKDAIEGNPGLAAAEANLRESEHALRAGYGVFFPAIGADYDASRQKFSPQRFGEAVAGSIFNLYTLSATVSYALDIFGGERRAVEALGATADQQRAVERGTYLTLSANVVDALIAAAAYQAEIAATRELAGIERRQVHLAEVQSQAGTAPFSTVLGLRSELAALEATIPQLEQKLDQTDDLLAALVGHPPSQWTPPAIDFAVLALPRDLPLSVPSDLVRQRPDVLAAEAAAHAASAEIGVATAAMLPSVTLTGTYGVNSTDSARLFAATSKFWSFGADVAAPLFEGGTLWFQRKAAIDAFDAAMAEYRQTVLAAFAQVADTLRGLGHDAEALAADDQAAEAARAALRLVQANYAAGLATYTDVLIADGQFHQAEIADLQARALRYQDTVALFAALGGGWWNMPTGAGGLSSAPGHGRDRRG